MSIKNSNNKNIGKHVPQKPSDFSEKSGRNNKTEEKRSPVVDTHPPPDSKPKK